MYATTFLNAFEKMLSAVSLGIVVLTFLIQRAGCQYLYPAPNDISSIHKDPLVVLISGGSHKELDQSQDGDTSSHSAEGDDDDEDDKNEAKLVFLNYLRTSPDEEEDPSLKQHKDVLRQALRARCKKVAKCQAKCPPKKKKCPNKCQEVFDEVNLCDPPKKKNCNKPKCGRTLPPSWRF